MEPVIYVCNVDEKSVVKRKQTNMAALIDAVSDETQRYCWLVREIESEIAVMESYDDRQMFWKIWDFGKAVWQGLSNLPTVFKAGNLFTAGAGSAPGRLQRNTGAAGSRVIPYGF